MPQIKELANHLFEYSYSLTDIYIPDTVEHIGKRAFIDVKPNFEILSPRIAEMVKNEMNRVLY